MVVTWTYDAPSNTATAAGAGSTNFAALVAADTAGGWGKYTADATGTQIICAGRIALGDTTNSLTLSDSSKQIMFTGFITSDNDYLIWLNAKSTLTLGVLNDAGTKSTSQGCSLYKTDNYYTVLIRVGSSTATLNLYSCQITGGGTTNFCYIGDDSVSGTVNMFNCVCSGVDLWGKPNWNVYRLTSMKSGWAALNNAGGVFNDISVSGSADAAIYANNQVNADHSISGLQAVLNQYLVDVSNFAYSVYLINAVVDSWVFRFSNSPSAVVYRQYIFNLQVIDNSASVDAGAIVPIENADVTLYDKDMTEVFNTTTDSNGEIAEQTVSRGYYDQTNGNTLQDYGPHFLVVTAAGYEDYMDEIVFDIRKDFQISMNLPAVPADLATAEPNDVAGGKTFFGKTGSMQTGTGFGTAYTSHETRTITVTKKDPLTEPALMATAALLIENQMLRTKRRNRMRLKT